jgi:hypothetical protein
MGSERQTKANRENAQKSTGPRTGGGRMRSSLNALKHGLSAKLIVLADENPQELEELLAEQHEEFQPNGALENAAVIEMTRALWRMRRAARIEVEAFGNRIEHSWGPSSFKVEVVLKDAIPFETLMKYRADAERSYYLALRAFRESREHPINAPTLPSPADLSEPENCEVRGYSRSPEIQGDSDR